MKIAHPAPIWGRRTALTSCPGRKAGAVAVFGLTSDRDDPTDFPNTAGVSTDCGLFRSAGSRATIADRVIKSNAQIFNTVARAGGAWR